MDLSNGFALWRDPSKTASGNFMSIPALTAMHWVHRALALVVLALAAWVGMQSLLFEGLRKTSLWLLLVIALQFLTGMVLLNFPLMLALVHNGMAALLVLLLTTLNYKIRRAG